MRTQKLNIYGGKVKDGVSNEYKTKPDAFKSPVLHYVVGVRNTGKSYLTSLMLQQAKNDNLYDKVYLVSPSANSNKAYFGKYVDDEDIFDPDDNAIKQVVDKVNIERDEFEDHLRKLEEWNNYKKHLKDNSVMEIPDNKLIEYMEMGFLDNMKPEWKYPIVRPPQSLMILDDVIGSQALSGRLLTKIATTNRHQGQLREPHSDRSALGLAVMILSQSYASNNLLARPVRENTSVITLFENKHQKQLEKIRDELASVIDVEKFDKAYEYATAEKYGNLTIDFFPKSPEYQFRKNLNELIIFDENKEIKNKK